MANLPEIVQYDTGVYQLETTDPVQGGAAGVSNVPAKNLANRTAWLKKHVDDLESGATIPPGIAKVNSQAFTGTPTVPTPPIGDSSLKIANTEFVQKTHNGVLSKNVAGGANVTLDDVEAGNGILIFIGALTANISVIVPTEPGNWIVANRTTGAFTLTVKTSAGTGIAVSQGKAQELICDGTNVVQSTSDFRDTALTGAPTAPTPASGSNGTSVATTEFVANAIDGVAAVNVAGGANVTVTAGQAGTGILNLTGAITANINLILPTQSGQWIIANNSSGAYNITAKMATGAGVVLPQGLAVVVYSDGTNVYLASSAGQSSLSPKSFAPAAGTTTLAITGGYTPGNLLVEKNGALLKPTDYTATASPNITLGTATIAGDTFTVYVFSSFQVADKSAEWGKVTGTLANQTDLQAALDAKASASSVTSASQTATWGNVTGTLASQTDLQNALNAKAASSHQHAAGDITSGVMATARLGSGTAGATTFLRGDGTWAVPAAPAWGSITGTLANQTDLNNALTAKGQTATWGNVSGTLASQTDLQNALNAKAALAGATFTGEVAAPSFNKTSALRFKENIEPIDTDEALSILLEVEWVRYTLKADGSRQAGVIAEKLAGTRAGFAVKYEEDGQAKAVDYESLFSLSMAALRGLAARVAALEGR